MTMLRMQADMQHKSYFPGCYTAWDLNSDANGIIWPPDNDVDRMLMNGQHYNGTLPPSSGSNMFYNKGLLKQTMLKHEAEFKDQIHELHRVYKRQKELMEELKQNDLYKLQFGPETLQPNLPCQPHIPEVKDSILLLHSYVGNIGEAGFSSTRIGSSSKASEFMESNCKKFGKKILDLELPADEYFDSEEEGFSEVKTEPEVIDMSDNSLKKILEVRDRVDDERSTRDIDRNSAIPEGSISLKKNVLADLNIPVELVEDIPESGDFQDPVFGHNEPSLQDSFGKSNSNMHVLSEEVIPNSQIMGDPEADLEVLHLDKHKMQGEHGSCLNKAGKRRNDLTSFSRDLYTEKLSIEHINNKQAQDCVICHGLDETDGKLCYEDLQHVAKDISASNYKPEATSNMCSSYRSVPLADTMVSKSSSVSSWRRAFEQIPIAVQALPCFTGKSSKSLTLIPGLPKNELRHGKNLASSTKSCSPVKYAKDSKCVGSVKSLDLNIISPSFSTDVAGSQDASLMHGEDMLQSSTGCSPQTAEILVHDKKSSERRDFSIPLESILEQANSLSVVGAGSEKVEARNSLNFKKMLGFYTYNKPPFAIDQCSSHASPSQNQEKLDKTKSIAGSEPFENCPGYGVIDLNSCLSMNESPLVPLHSIDLEPPASPENKECSPPRGESNENQLETPLPSLRRDDGDLVKNAVEAIVSFSSSKIQTRLERSGCEPFKAHSSLYWFARVASSAVDDPRSEFGVNIGVKDYDDHDEYLSDGIDYFEVSTLNLTEVKVEESWCKSNSRKEEEPSANFSKNQPKRGRTRRGRQRKDFQSEILPSLASLSRYEVTEDLQLIGGLIEASGTKACRNGYTKGRRRTNARSSNVTENMTNMVLRSGKSEPRRLIEWGKITRGRRGPRCPSSNPRLILGQV